MNRDQQTLVKTAAVINVFMLPICLAAFVFRGEGWGSPIAALFFIDWAFVIVYALFGGKP